LHFPRHIIIKKLKEKTYGLDLTISILAIKEAFYPSDGSNGTGQWEGRKASKRKLKRIGITTPVQK
jgi:hypothetical protein